MLVIAGGVAPRAALAGATPWQETTGGALRLIWAGGGVDAQGRLEAGLEIRLDAGWKTYWRYPGDSGIGTTADFSGSTNVARTALAFTAPERAADDYATSIVYHGDVVLPIFITPAHTSAPSELDAAVSMGICDKVCVPVQASFSATIGPDEPRDPDAARAIDAARARVPLPARAGDALSVSDVEIDKGADALFRFTAKLTDDSGRADLFVEGPEGSYLTVPERVSRAPGTALFTLPVEGLVASGKTAVLRLTLVNGDKAVVQDWPLEMDTLK